MVKTIHAFLSKTYFLLRKLVWRKPAIKGLFLILLFSFIFVFEGRAQLKFVPEKEIPSFVYDEIPVNVMVEGYQNFDLDVIYTNTDLLYVNIEELFRTLQIPCKVGQNGDSLGGFIGNESNSYSIDFSDEKVKVGSRNYNAPNALVKEMGSIYMESSLFAEAFSIKMTFNYRTLSIVLKTDFELPVIKQQRTEKLRNNISKIRGVEIVDTIVQRNYHLFRFGMVDWSLTSSQVWKGLTDNRFSIGVGTEFLNGEANVSYNYYAHQKFDGNQLLYLWRWVDNDKKIIRQAQLGKISTQSISFLNSQVLGAVVRNTPTTVRKATGYYTINEFTEPNWTVELYINNVLVDFTKADASGMYIFKVPIVYGYTTLKLKFYGPLGEERTDERTINVPYSVMPAGEFEYGLTAAVVQDSTHGQFGRGEFNYGVTRKLTIGGGMEYLSSIPNGPFIPYATATLQPFSKMTINAEYAYGVRTRGLMNYYVTRDILFVLDYTKYVEGQLATRFNALEERKAKLSVPFRVKKIIGTVKLDYTQLLYKEFSYNYANVMLSTYYKQFSANTSAQLNWVDRLTPYILADLALSYRTKNGITLRPSAQFNVNAGTFVNYKAEIEKRIAKGYISVAYERNVAYNDNYINVCLKYDLPFARTSISASQSKGVITTSESAQGSLAFGGDNNFTHVSINPSTSKGGILLYPFLDLNRNGVFDQNERMVKLTSVKVSGGRPIYNDKDSIIRIPDLNAFTTYTLGFSDYNLENIAWQFTKKSYQVLIDPNQFKRIDIAVVAVGEANGMAYLDRNNSLKGIGRIWIKIYDKKNRKLAAETLSESDGYIYYLGLAPGDYFACVDSVQLNNLGFTADPPCRDFTIKPVEDGDIVDGLDFILKSEQIEAKDKQQLISVSKTGDPAGDSIIVAQQPEIAPPNDPSKINANELPENNEPSALPLFPNQAYIAYDTVDYPAGTYFKVQLLALLTPIKIAGYFGLLQNRIPGLKIVETIEPDGFYHYSTGVFGSYAEAKKYERLIRHSGWIDCFITVYTSGKRE